MEALLKKLRQLNDALINAEQESELITGMRHVPTEAFFKVRRKIEKTLTKETDEVVDQLYAFFTLGKKKTFGSGKVEMLVNKNDQIKALIDTLHFMDYIEKGMMF